MKTLISRCRMALLIMSTSSAVDCRPRGRRGLLLSLTHLALANAASPVDPRSLRPPLTYADQFKATATSPIQMQPIAVVESPYKERFGTPRQSVVTAQTAGASAQDGAILLASHIPRETLQDLDGFSHAWIIASLHLNTGCAAASHLSSVPPYVSDRIINCRHLRLVQMEAAHQAASRAAQREARPLCHARPASAQSDFALGCGNRECGCESRPCCRAWIGCELVPQPRSSPSSACQSDNLLSACLLPLPATHSLSLSGSFGSRFICPRAAHRRHASTRHQAVRRILRCVCELPRRLDR